MSSEGDHITLLNVYRAYKGVNGNKVGNYSMYTQLIKVSMATR